MVSPYAKRIMKHEQFTTLPSPESVLLIAVTPEDLGFTERPTIAEVLNNERLAEWSDANFPGWQVTLNPAEVGPHLAIQYTGQTEGEFLWVGMSEFRAPAADHTFFISNGTTKAVARSMPIGLIRMRYGNSIISWRCGCGKKLRCDDGWPGKVHRQGQIVFETRPAPDHANHDRRRPQGQIARAGQGGSLRQSLCGADHEA